LRRFAGIGRGEEQLAHGSCQIVTFSTSLLLPLGRKKVNSKFSNKEVTVSSQAAKPALYTQYPLFSVILYIGLTLIHFVLGGLGIFLGYNDSLAYLLSAIYLVFAFGQMLVVMPLTVCPSCVYYRLENGRCIGALNLLSRRIAAPGRPVDFRRRAKGWLCHNNLYLTALVAPIPLMILGLLLNFSVTLVAILLVVIALLLFRFFVMFPKIACGHCMAKQKCPNAAQMGLNK
jgi:hypothetical protein